MHANIHRLALKKRHGLQIVSAAVSDFFVERFDKRRSGQLLIDLMCKFCISYKNQGEELIDK